MGSKRASTPNFGDAIRPFVEAGISPRALLPIAPRGAKIAKGSGLKPKSCGKAPGFYDKQRDEWSGLKGEYVKQGVKTRAEQGEFATWHTENAGMLGRYAPAIDSDAETDDARRLVEQVLAETFGHNAKIAQRIRGTGPRRLYAFRAANMTDEHRIIRTRHTHYRLPNDPEHICHKLDIIGTGGQYVITGVHPSGDKYEWDPNASLADLFRTREILAIEDVDIERFLKAFEKAINRLGGAVISSSGGRASDEHWDYSNEDPIMPVHAILEGLQHIPNTHLYFPDRISIVRMLSMIRAALGREAQNHEADVEAWACADPEWCPPDYFEGIWQSLKQGVGVKRDALDREFRLRGILVGAKYAFPDDAHNLMLIIREMQAKAGRTKAALLAEVASKYLFGHVNTRTDDNSPRVRLRNNASMEWQATSWWRHESPDIHGVELLRDIQRQEGWGRNRPDFWNFLRDLAKAHPDCFYVGEIKHPHYDYGEMVGQSDESEHVTYRVNMRHLPRVQKLAKRPSRNDEQSRKDLANILEFIERIFGQHLKYELDTLAYMVQTGQRPGHLLFLVGDSGVGKSIYIQMLAAMFDGIGPESTGSIDGTKLTNENALRFAWSKVDGCRIINVKELPEGSRTGTMAIITSLLKQRVDPGPDGNYFSIEEKGKDVRSVPNFARIVITSNYQNAIRVEAQDRRIFYILCGITRENKPNDTYYGELLKIIHDPERLATFWRYLNSFDIHHYRVAAPPPVSLEKREAQIAAMTNPIERHAEAALMVLRRAGRNLFDAREISEIMTGLAHNEFRNLNGAIDDRRTYQLTEIMEKRTLGRVLDRHANKIGDFKSGSKRLPTVYCFKTAQDECDELLGANRKEVMEALKRDRDLNPLSDEHPIPQFVGPTNVAKGTQPMEEFECDSGMSAQLHFSKNSFQ